jgi:hypothetical protein
MKTPMAEPRGDALLAWRIWAYRDNRLHPSLGENLPPDIRTAAWRPREAEEAKCPLVRHHESPHPRCTCGYYAVKRLATALSWARARNRAPASEDVIVVGRVALWGRVIEHEDGYRAQHAYPQALYVLGPSPVGARLANLYGVEGYQATWEELEERAIQELAVSPPPALVRSFKRLRFLRGVLSSRRVWTGALLGAASLMIYGLWGTYRHLRDGVSDSLTPLVLRLLYASWMITVFAGILGIPNLAVHGYEFELFMRSQQRTPAS